MSNSFDLKAILHACACLALVVPACAIAEEYVGLVHPVREITLSMGVGGVVAAVAAAGVLVA